MKNPVCRGRKTLAQPRWLGSPARYVANGGHSGSVVWSFYDPDRTGLELICRSPPAIFGTYIRARKFTARPALSQCDRCHRFGHLISDCPRPPSTVICYRCGGPHHSSNHTFHCRNQKAHPGKTCSCPPSCFLCRERNNGKHMGHHARSDDNDHPCPVRRSYRLPPPPTIPSDAETITPSPAAAGPFTVIDDSSPPPTVISAPEIGAPVLPTPHV
jgi:hypothetical protein